MSKTANNQETAQRRQAPNGWRWGVGNRSATHYTHHLQTDKVLYDDGKFGWEAEIYWDRGSEHTVVFRQITRLKDNGDLLFEHPSHVESFENEDNAFAYAIAKASQLR